MGGFWPENVVAIIMVWVLNLSVLSNVHCTALPIKAAPADQKKIRKGYFIRIKKVVEMAMMVGVAVMVGEAVVAVAAIAVVLA